MIAVPEELRRILRDTPELRRSYLVGGCVRDAILGISHQDFDIEVFETGYEALLRALSRWGRTNLVGRSFGVIKLTTAGGALYDFSLPRRDSKVAPGHTGFEITVDPTLMPREAASRRDFTVNALMYDLHAGELLDFFGGVEDLRGKKLRHTSDAFSEDPLRVLRGMQLCARFELKPASETLVACLQMKNRFHELAIERVREEWLKWASTSRLPSAGLTLLRESGWLSHFPELECLTTTPQDPEWHPEGTVWVHTCHACDALAGLDQWQNESAETRAVLMFAALSHDFGKALTTTRSLRRGVWRTVSPKHEVVGVELAMAFLARIGITGRLSARVGLLVRHHMVGTRLSDRAIRRLARRVEPENIRHLALVMTADRLGRSTFSPSSQDQISDLLNQAAKLAVADMAPRPILQGRHLIDLGFEPGRRIGQALAVAFDAQLNGVFHDLRGAYSWLRSQRSFALPETVSTKLQSGSQPSEP